jgi:hypothetical protein
MRGCMPASKHHGCGQVTYSSTIGFTPFASILSYTFSVATQFTVSTGKRVNF